MWLLRKPFLNKFGFRLDDVFQTKYEQAALRSAIADVIGDKKIGDISLSRLVIPAVDLVNGRTIVFKTPHLPKMTRDRSFALVDVLLATTAAPTYFPAAKVDQKLTVVDGGLWANNPSIVALAETQKILENFREGSDPKFSMDEVMVLSVGTGSPGYSIAPPNETGLAWWGPQLVNLVLNSQGQGVDFQMKYLLGERYRRVDFSLPDNSWTLDAVKITEQLISKGCTAAHDQLADILDIFMKEESASYHAFPETNGG